MQMQIQADLLGRPVERPSDIETTARGAAVAAMLGCGKMKVGEAFAPLGKAGPSAWLPRIDDGKREAASRQWDRAVERSLGLSDL